MTWFRRILAFLFGEPPVVERPTPSPSPAPAPTAAPATLPEPAADPYFAAAASPAVATSPAAPAVGPSKKGSNLDASAFLPITREEQRAGADALGRGPQPWFGRRDLIPPADDPRTRLIDRGLVTEGLLTPEQLAEIHDVGNTMERVRPTLASLDHRATTAGEEAVAADRESRARLKALKKAEAAERRRARAEAVAHRRQTDIVFLGRGVSAGLADRQSDVAALERAGLPVLSTPAELAAALGISVPRLRWLAFHNEAATRVHYVQFEVPKRSGGRRILSAPHRELARAQRWIFENVLSRLAPEEPAAHGFVAGRSILTNALPHAGRAVVVNLDLEGFFPSVGFPRVKKVFRRAGYSPAVATTLALLCTECPRRTVVFAGTTYHVAVGPRGLPQGACTSPGLSNQVARRLDRRLAGLAGKLGLTYTRYADDLTFSGGTDFESRVGYLLARVRHIAAAEGFTVKESKTRVLRRSQAQVVTGLVVNDRPGAPRDEVRRLRAILHRARAEGLAAQNRENRPNFEAWLRGKIAFVGMARPDLGAKLRAELDSLVRPT